MLLLGLLLMAASGAFAGLLIADNLSGGPEYQATVLGHDLVTLNSLAVFLSGLALGLLFCLGLVLAGVGRRTRRPVRAVPGDLPARRARHQRPEPREGRAEPYGRAEPSERPEPYERAGPSQPAGPAPSARAGTEERTEERAAVGREGEEDPAPPPEGSGSRIRRLFDH
ncbi:hypothetical protein [Kitasatospora sp. NPDC047058]|uniref:hypothetical protein n=1 Tax=Kitasatospora sp. NPDC047058 TaxID=3155620 RepID=UPI00340C4DB8